MRVLDECLCDIHGLYNSAKPWLFKVNDLKKEDTATIIETLWFHTVVQHVEIIFIIIIIIPTCSCKFSKQQNLP